MPKKAKPNLKRHIPNVQLVAKQITLKRGVGKALGPTCDQNAMKPTTLSQQVIRVTPSRLTPPKPPLPQPVLPNPRRPIQKTNFATTPTLPINVRETVCHL